MAKKLVIQSIHCTQAVNGTCVCVWWGDHKESIAMSAWSKIYYLYMNTLSIVSKTIALSEQDAYAISACSEHCVVSTLLFS